MSARRHIEYWMHQSSPKTSISTLWTGPARTFSASDWVLVSTFGQHTTQRLTNSATSAIARTSLVHFHGSSRCAIRNIRESQLMFTGFHSCGGYALRTTTHLRCHRPQTAPHISKGPQPTHRMYGVEQLYVILWFPRPYHSPPRRSRSVAEPVSEERKPSPRSLRSQVQYPGRPPPCKWRKR